jgi:hypothetical protein
MSVAFLALAAAAQAASPAPAPTPQPAPAAPTATAAQAKTGERQCAEDGQTGSQRAIVICAQRPQGYRINPDILEARRETRSAGRPTRPGGSPRPDCETVGPIPCTSAGMNLIGAALTAVAMAQRAAKGESVGQMFVTDPQPDEYHLYLMANARREQREAEAKAKKVKAQAQARTQASAAPSAPATTAPAQPDGK